MHRVGLRALWVVALVVAAVGPAAAESIADKLAEVADEFSTSIPRTMRRERITGLSVAVVHGDQIVWSQGFGESDREKKVPATDDTRYQVGDISKAVTALSIMRLVELGKADLDVDIREYIPDLTIETHIPDAGPVTLRRLLTHHSGIISNRWQGLFQPEPELGLPQIDSVYLSQRPGEIYAYSSLGFQVAGRVVEALSGEPFVNFVEREVLARLGMNTATYFADDLAVSYEKRRKVDPSFPRDLAALGLQGSVKDLARLAIAMIRPEQSGFDPASIREVQRRQNGDIAFDLDNQTGLAWQLTNAGRYRIERLLRINNASLGYSGLLLIAPEEELAVTVLSNAANAFADTIEIGEDVFDAAIEAVTGREPPDRDDYEISPAPLPAVAVDTDMADAYVSALGLAEFNRAGEDRYDVRFLGRNFRADRLSSGWFQLRYRLLRLLSLSLGILDEMLLRPVVIEGRELLLVQFRDYIFVLGARHDNRPLEGDWTQLAGRYRLSNPDWISEKLKIKDVEVSEKGGALFVTYRLPFFFKLEPKLPLVPLTDRSLIMPGLGTNMGEIVNIEGEGDSTTLVYSGYRFTRR